MLSKIDLQGNIVEVNELFCSVTQFKKERLLGASLRILKSEYHPSLFFKELWERILLGEMWHGDIKNKRSSGDYYWARTTIIPVRDSQGAIRHFINIQLEITEKKEREQRQQFDAQTLGEIVGVAKVGGWIYYPESKELYWSRETYLLHDVAVDEKMTIERAFSFYPKEVQPVIQKAVENAIQSHQGWDLELPICSEKGRYFWTHSVGKVELKDSKIYRIFGTFQDISDRKEFDQKLLQTQKLESLGVMAGGIAHDFNNLLTGIIGNAEFVRSTLPLEHSAHHALEVIEQTSYRASELCSQMLAYAGKGRFEKCHYELNSLIQETLNLVQHSLDKRIVVNLDLQDSLPNVFVDSAQIRQIVMNLVINAGDSIGGQVGEILIETRSVFLNENDLKGGILSAESQVGPYIRFKVRDTGSGMSEETLKRIFEPFYTTKFTGRGLGLSAVLGIIQGHQGFLNVQSKVGMGTVFEVYLPVPLEQELSPKLKQDSTHWSGKGLVLLVEDEPLVREVSSRRLTQFMQ